MLQNRLICTILYGLVSALPEAFFNDSTVLERNI